ncbi:MAG: hypothetical protein R2761_27805 [Acidimicrobiales bacterium]
MPETTVERPAATPPAGPALPLWRRGPVVVAFSMIMVFVCMAALLIWQASHSDWRRQLPPVDGVTVTTTASPAGAGEVTRP